jgi:hypothetical protein
LETVLRVGVEKNRLYISIGGMTAKSKSNLVIVESPAKAKTIEKYLGADFRVVSSVSVKLVLKPHTPILRLHVLGSWQLGQC